MKISRLALALPMVLACAQPTLAKQPVPALPIGSPGDWVTEDDYPAAATRLGMVGTSAFRLTISPTGQPIACEITHSSGFDVLDNATCDLLKARARFTPGRDPSGKAVEARYMNRVHWVMPHGKDAPVSERHAVAMLTVDAAGAITACQMDVLQREDNGALGKQACPDGWSNTYTIFGEDLGKDLRKRLHGDVAQVEIDLADIFSSERKANILAPKTGFTQRTLTIHRFTVTREGKLGDCSFEEQRGDVALAQDFCRAARYETYDPPFAAIGKDGVAQGWHIVRVMLKTGA